MNLPYFYEENIQEPVHTLSEETSRHCVQVLRMKNGEQLQLTDGKGNLFFATISGLCKPPEDILYRLMQVRDMFLEIARKEPGE